MQRKPILKYLASSSKHAGRLYPVLVDKYGNIIDGVHRLTVDKNWPKVTVEGVETEEQLLIARLISNVCRRNVPAKEKTEMLGRLGEIYRKEGIKPGEIAYKIAEKTGMSYQWIMKYLPEKFKDPSQSNRAKSALRRRAGDPSVQTLLNELLTPPRKNRLLKVKKYLNAPFVNVMVEKSFYEEFENISQELGVPTEISILKALEDYHEKMKKALAIKEMEEKTDKQKFTFLGEEGMERILE